LTAFGCAGVHVAVVGGSNIVSNSNNSNNGAYLINANAHFWSIVRKCNL